VRQILEGNQDRVIEGEVRKASIIRPGVFRPENITMAAN
jgi:hypothetical protein